MFPDQGLHSKLVKPLHESSEEQGAFPVDDSPDADVDLASGTELAACDQFAGARIPVAIFERFVARVIRFDVDRCLRGALQNIRFLGVKSRSQGEPGDQQTDARPTAHRGASSLWPGLRLQPPRRRSPRDRRGTPAKPAKGRR